MIEVKELSKVYRVNVKQPGLMGLLSVWSVRSRSRRRLFAMSHFT